MATATVDVTPKPPQSAKGNSSTLHAVDKPKTLIEKVAEACNAVGGIEKRGHNEKQDYDYLMAADVAAAFRRELFTRGIILLQDEESAEFKEYETRNGGIMQECRLKIRFILKDDSAELVSYGYGVGRDTFDKAIYKAKTGATKYFLRGLGLVPDRADDPESSEDREVVNPERQKPQQEQNYPPRRPAAEDKPPAPSAAGAILNFQKNAFLSAAKKSNKTQPQITAYLGSIGCESLDEMPKKAFPEALKWAME